MTETGREPVADTKTIESLKRYFVGRSDTYAIQQSDGSYIRVDRPLTDDVLRSHLEGETTVGVYQIEPEKNTVKWLCFDVDSKEIAEVERLKDSIVKSGFCPQDNILVEDTGGRGYHLWIFFDPPIPALVAYYVGRKFEQQSKVKCEVFPKQRVVEAYGNLVKLPLGIHRKTGERSTFVYVNSLDQVTKISFPQDEVAKAVQEAQKWESGWMERTASKGKGYSGEDPPCVRFWFSGVDPGNRNNVAIRLASHYRNFAKLDLDATLARMMEWNARNAEPLPRAEITNIVGSADKGGYNYSCEDEFWKQGCQIERCPLKIRELPVATGQVSEDVNAQIDELIAKGPVEFIRFLQQCLEYKMTGEWKNRLFLLMKYAALVQRTSMIRIWAQSGAGKSWLTSPAEDVLGKDRVVSFSYSTANTLKRKIWKGFEPTGKLFILQEERAIDDRGPNVKYQFELAYSENSVKFEWNELDENGRWEPVSVELKGPLGFITTSIEREKSAHAETREVMLSVDESREQSNKIHWWDRWRREVPPKELEREEKDLEVLRGYFARLRSYKRIVIPFLDYIRYEHFKVHDRRKEKEFLGWIEDTSILFQPWLPKDPETDTLFALPFVFDFVSAITDQIIVQTRGELTQSERFVLNAIMERKNDQSLFRYTTAGKLPKILGSGSNERYDEGPTAFKTTELAKLPEFSTQTERWVRELAASLADKGYLESHGDYRYRVYSIGTSPEFRKDSLVSRFIPRFAPISEEFPNRKSDAFMRYCHEYAEHSVGRKLPPSLLDNEYFRLELNPEDCLFQPDWPESRKSIRKSAGVPIGESDQLDKTSKITEKGLEGLQWRNLSDETETMTSDIIDRLVRHGKRGQKRRGKAKKTPRPRGRKRRRKKAPN